MDENYILEMSHITKKFPGVTALTDVSFNIKKGEIHALVGENGAGKSTLMKILGGVYSPEEGSILINGKSVKIDCPSDSIRCNIGIIYQELNLVPDLSISENIYLGKELVKSGNVLNRTSMTQKSAELMSRLGMVEVDCNSLINDLSIAKQQLVEIAKALSNDVNILIMDEPTSVLTEKETESLMEVIRNLKQKGVSIIYISHRLEEVLAISDRITVLRDGQIIETLDTQQTSISKETIIKLMVGRDLNEYFPQRKLIVGTTNVLEVEGLTKNGVFENIGFQLKKGEILGFAGLIGAGRSEVMKALFGALPYEAGKIIVDGKNIVPDSPIKAIQSGIALVPEDRKKEGLVLGMSLADNICLPNQEKISKFGYIVRKLKKTLIDQFIHSLSIRPNFPERLIKDFSGGNQQKAVISKWLAVNPKILILDEPTRGIDIGAKAEIYALIHKLTEKGISIILISSELLEVMGISDRILVMWEGKITAEFSKAEVTQDKIMMAAAGLAR
ncbi:MAG TPA: D-xylose ABC transporter ATP-binding protein [Firmicutes bacterium]|nr:D-xylose ABC transporter ATP-binding protein [Bacillota bacterium]